MEAGRAGTMRFPNADWLDRLRMKHGGRTRDRTLDLSRVKGVAVCNIRRFALMVQSRAIGSELTD